MTHWSFHNPVQVIFGSGSIEHFGDLVDGCSYILVTHPDAALKPWIERLVQVGGDPLAILNGVDRTPDLALLERLTAQWPRVAAQQVVLVALGGGSAIDAVKFLAASHGSFSSSANVIEDLQTPAHPSLPFIAIPTTAGTGSDVTRWATIWDTERNRKLSLERDDLFAEATIIDPEIMRSLPWPVTLASGLDALSHALESLWNHNASPITRDFAISGAREIIDILPKLQANPDYAEARVGLARGALRASLAFSNTRTAVAHNISYPVTLNHGTPHGIACSFCLPEAMAAAIGVKRECDDALAAIFGALDKAPARLRSWLDDLGIPARPAELGINPEQWQTYVEQAFVGPRGRNFIGSIDRFPHNAIAGSAS